MSPLQNEGIHELRQSKNARKFRQWLETNAINEPNQDMVREYVDSIAQKNGLFDSAPAKFLRSIAVTAVGAGVGLAAGSLTVDGMSLSASAVGVGGAWALDLLDRFVIEKIAEGWSPKMFFNDVARLRKGSAPIAAPRG